MKVKKRRKKEPTLTVFTVATHASLAVVPTRVPWAQLASAVWRLVTCGGTNPRGTEMKLQLHIYYLKPLKQNRFDQNQISEQLQNPLNT